jgi:hypothetical protein
MWDVGDMLGVGCIGGVGCVGSVRCVGFGVGCGVLGMLGVGMC